MSLCGPARVSPPLRVPGGPRAPRAALGQGGEGLGAGTELRGLTWGVLLRVHAPISRGDRVPRRTGVRCVPRSFWEVPSCRADGGVGGTRLGFWDYGETEPQFVKTRWGLEFFGDLI